MGKLIIDGNSVFEIDEECLKRKKVPLECDIKKYLQMPKESKELVNQYEKSLTNINKRSSSHSK